jgi:hypothetical protein
MPKAVPKKRAKTPRRPPDQVRGLELAKHKLKIRTQKEEIDKLKRSIKELRSKSAMVEESGDG